MSFISPLLTLEQLKLEKTVKLGVMASGSGSNFEVICEAIANQELNAEIPILIYNNPDAKVKERADRWGVATKLLNHRNYKKREDLDQAIVEEFQAHNIDLVIMAGWMRIVTNVLLKAYDGRVINIHPSLLPSFRGIHAVEQALAAKVKITGCTVHLADLEVDHGPILMQAAVPILEDDTSESLHTRIQEQEHLIFPRAIALRSQQIFTEK
jgi:phosphoribosylglycinamide formyltransferase 1